MQQEFNINFSGRGHLYTPEEIEVVVKAMTQADPLTQGKYRDQFEQKFAAYQQTKHAFAVCNATAALEMAAQLCQFKPGEEVIIPTHTFTATAYPFLKKGARPVWADIDPDTRVVTADTLAARITPQTKAIIVVHLYGYVADMPAIMDLAREHQILVIEDAAQAIGATLNGIKAGSFGDMGVFSFHSHKNISTLGEGGMLTVNDDRYAAVLPMLRHNGHAAFNFERSDYWLPGMGDVDFPELNGERLWPNNFCLGEVECALGTKLLDRIDDMNTARRRRAIDIIDSLSDYTELVFQREDSDRHNYHQLVGWFSNGKRNDFMRKMANDKKIKCILPYYPLHHNSMYKKLGYGTADCPNTDRFFSQMTSFPFHHWLSDEEIASMVAATREVLKELRS